MKPQFFFVVLDTVESTTIRSLPRSILNTYIIKAYDENHAKQMILRTMPANIAEQLSTSVYVYDLDAIMYNIDNAFAGQRSLPLFSFMPLNGQRPHRTINLPSRPDGESETVEVIVNPPAPVVAPETASVQQPQPINESVNRQQTSTPVQNAPVDPRNARAVRSAAFQQNDYVPQGRLNENLTPEQARLVSSLGVHPSRYGADEGVNNRINSSTGQNLNQTRINNDGGPTNQLSREQMELLNSIGATPSSDTEVIRETMNEDAAWIPEDDLSQIDGEVLSDDKLIEIQNEFKSVAEETGIDIGDSTPVVDEKTVSQIGNVSLGLAQSQIDSVLNIKKSGEDYE